jgi:hypothetical protein
MAGTIWGRLARAQKKKPKKGKGGKKSGGSKSNAWRAYVGGK